MELNSLAKMERERRGCLGWKLTANLCTGGPSSNMLSGSSIFFHTLWGCYEFRSWEKAAGFLESNGQHLFYFFLNFFF